MAETKQQRYDRRNPERRRESQRRWAERNPDASRTRQIRRRYGITPAEYEQMVVAQDGKCAICRRAEGDGRGRRLHIDHDHTLNKKRALLCYRCNAGLGFFMDNPGLLRQAAEYLNAHR